MSSFRCSCGREHSGKEGLQIVGWQNLECGEIALLVNCPEPCGSTICAEYHTDAALCTRCRQPITDGSRKVYDEETRSVYCEPCAAKLAIGMQPVAVAFREYVKYGSAETLANWRMTVRLCMGAAS